MAVIRHSFTARPIPADLLARWRQVPPAIAGDCLNRDHCMTGRIAPLAPGMAITGPARTRGSVVRSTRRWPAAMWWSHPAI